MARRIPLRPGRPATLVLVLLLAAPAALAGDGGGPSLPRPSNDRFVNAKPLALTLPREAGDERSTHGATAETSEPLPCGMGATVWYSLQAVRGGFGLLRVDTAGSDFDTVVAIYGGSGIDGLRLVGCARGDPEAGSRASLVAFVSPHETHFIQAGGASGAVGHLRLRVSDASPQLA